MNQKSSLTLAVDPGSIITGYALIERGPHPIDFGVIKPPKTLPIHERYAHIHRGLLHLIGKYQPTAFVIETQYVDKNVATAMKIGMARAISVLAATLHEIPLFEYAPSSAKKAVVGSGNASKEQVQKMIQSLLGLSSLPSSDEADALALALCHTHRVSSCMNI